MITVTTLASGALLFALAGQSAQDAPDPLDPAGMEQTAPDTAADTASEDFSDDEIDAFVASGLAIRALREDAAQDPDAMQAEAEAIIAANGLDRATYNAIGNAAQEDPALAARVQRAIGEARQSAES